MPIVFVHGSQVYFPTPQGYKNPLLADPQPVKASDPAPPSLVDTQAQYASKISSSEPPNPLGSEDLDALIFGMEPKKDLAPMQYSSNSLPNINATEPVDFDSANKEDQSWLLLPEEKQSTQSKRLLTAKDIMSTNVISLYEDKALSDALRLISENGFRHIPVLSYGDALMGIISERDIFRWLHRHPKQSLENFYRTPVINLMICEVLSVTENTSVKDIVMLMQDKSIGSLPVIGEDAFHNGPTVKGIITKSDLYCLLVRKLEFF